MKAESNGWGSATTLTLAAVALALLAAFVFIERRHPAPLIRLGIFRTRSLSVANGVMLLAAGGLFAFFFFSTLYVQLILGYSPLEAGLAFLPVAIGIGVGAGLAGQLVKRIGVRSTTVIGMLMAAFGLWLFSRAPVDGSYLSHVFPAIIPQSLGMGLTFVPVTLIATTNVANEDAGLASGLFNTSQQIGGALGLAILSTLAADKTDDGARRAERPPRPRRAGGRAARGLRRRRSSPRPSCCSSAPPSCSPRCAARTSRTSTRRTRRCRAPSARASARSPARSRTSPLIERRGRRPGKLGGAVFSDGQAHRTPDRRSAAARAPPRPPTPPTC